MLYTVFFAFSLRLWYDISKQFNKAKQRSVSMGHNTKRDSWGSKWGFILACIGSAVGMGNIWLFPARVSAYGGATFLIPYLIFVLIISSSGVIGEMAFGRATRSGPIHAFGFATKQRFGTEKPGKLLGLIPVAGSMALAIGYSVVVGWIFKYLFLSVTGTLTAMDNVDSFINLFNTTAAGNPFWQILALAITLFIMVMGIGKGIEKANKLMTPMFYILFISLAVYLATLPAASSAYRYIFVLDPRGLLDPMVWVFALGQAFFSLSIAGNGTLIYGSYLSNNSNIPSDARMVALFDTCAAMLASLVIIPAMAVAGEQLNNSGPGLMFIFLPNVLRTIPGADIILVIFFLAVVFAALTSLINMFEAPIATLQEVFRLPRTAAVAIIGTVGVLASLLIAPIVSDWMDVCSIYICPLGALLAGVMFFWLCKKDFVLDQVNLARKKPLGAWFYPVSKYIFCGVTVLVLVMGALLDGIG